MEHNEQRATAGQASVPGEYSSSSMVKKLAVVVLVVVVGAGGFVGGMQYQKKDGNTSTGTLTAAQGVRMGGTGMQDMRSGSIGTVTAVSASSITLSDERTDTTKTYSITNSTKITKDGSMVVYSSISVGTRVLVTVSSATSTVATQILVNPIMGGGFGGQSQAMSGSFSTSQTTN
jgi:hypothetical protein